MSSGNIKGITIRFEGDTTRLDKALRKINNSTKDIDKELRNVDKALKFNPTSVELWRQKQTLLEQKIKQTRKNLEELKSAQAQMDAQGVDKNSEAYRRVQREIIEAESKLKMFEGQLKKIGNVKLQAVGEQFKQWGGSIEQAGQKMQGLSLAAAGVVTSLGAISYKAGQNADDLNTMSKVYGIGTKDLQKYSAAADLVDVSVETIAKSHVKLEKSMASALKGTGANAEAFEKLGVSVVDANGDLRNGDEVWQDVIKALGKVENETERDALAMQLMGKSAAELNPLIEDGGETYEKMAQTMQKYGLDFVDQETLDKANQFNDELDTMKAIGAVALQSVGSQLAATLAPALEKVVGWIGQLANWLSNLNPKVLTVVGIVASVIAALAPVLIVVGKLATGIGAIIKLIAVVGPALAGIVATIGPVILVIGALIAIGVLLYKNWDTIKAKASDFAAGVKAKFTEIKTGVTNTINTVKTFLTNAWNTIKTTATTAWNGIKDAITKPIQTAKDAVDTAVKKIKGFFPISIGNILKNIKTPHFSLEMGSKSFGKLGTISYPTGFNVEWYAQGGIFDQPTLAGIGEAGPEAVVPLDKLWSKMDKIAEGGGNTYNFYITGDNPKQIADEVKRILIRDVNRERLAWQ